MVMAHSLDLANTYSAYFKNQIVPNILGILYYGRYIDNVIFIMIAKSKDDAEAKVKALEIGTCRITWDPARTYGVFLDVRLWIENGVIHHRPHRKIAKHYM
jgi:ABC-type transport system substrate-binding protein